MKTTIENNFGSFEHVQELIMNSNIKIGMDYTGTIQAMVTWPAGYSTTKTKDIVVKYSGYIGCNSGIANSAEQPFQMTDKARIAFLEFEKHLRKELLEYIKNS